MNPIPLSSILHIFLKVNRIFRIKLVFVFLLFASLVFSNKANAVEVVIEGASAFVCPNKSVTYTARTYQVPLSPEINSCSIAWHVYKGNEIVELRSW